MSLLKRLVMILDPAGFDGMLGQDIDSNIFSAYNLCVLAVEELTASSASTYVLCIEQERSMTAALASTYSLAVT